MRSFFILVLAFLAMALFQRDWLVLGSFKLNQEQLAKTKCVEREVEGNCCQASCVLKERLNEEQENPEQSLLEEETFHLFVESYYSLHQPGSSDELKWECRFPLVGGDVREISQRIFRPPILS